MKTVTSRQNALVARFRAVARARRAVRCHLLLDGVRLVKEARQAGVRLEAVIVSAPALRRRNAALVPLVTDLETEGVEVIAGSESVLAAVSPVRTASIAVAIGRHRPMALDDIFSHGAEAGASACVIGLVGVQDPGNVGTIIRAADAAGVGGVAVAATSADPFGWKALRGAMGSTFRLPVVDTGDPRTVVETARANHARVLAAVPRGGQSIYDVDLTGSVLILLGGEGAGLESPLSDASDGLVTVPMARSVESLNVAAAASVILYEARRQRLNR